MRYKCVFTLWSQFPLRRRCVFALHSCAINLPLVPAFDKSMCVFTLCNPRCILVLYYHCRTPRLLIIYTPPPPPPPRAGANIYQIISTRAAAAAPSRRVFCTLHTYSALKHDDVIADVSHLVIMSSKLLVHREFIFVNRPCHSALCFKCSRRSAKSASHYLWSIIWRACFLTHCAQSIFDGFARLSRAFKHLFVTGQVWMVLNIRFHLISHIQAGITCSYFK
jgi:hypothetical protein